MRHPNVNKRINSPDLLIFNKFHRHILKNRTMLFPTTFISASEKIGLKKQAANFFYFSFTRRRVVQYSCFDFFTSAKWRYFQLSGLWNTYLTYWIRRTATHVHFQIHKVLNFPMTEIFVPKMTYEADYHYGSINSYGDKKAYTSQSDFYGSLMKLYMILLNCEIQIYTNVVYHHPIDTCCLICKAFHGVWLFICK